MARPFKNSIEEERFLDDFKKIVPGTLLIAPPISALLYSTCFMALDVPFYFAEMRRNDLTRFAPFFRCELEVWDLKQRARTTLRGNLMPVERDEAAIAWGELYCQQYGVRLIHPDSPELSQYDDYGFPDEPDEDAS